MRAVRTATHTATVHLANLAAPTTGTQRGPGPDMASRGDMNLRVLILTGFDKHIDPVVELFGPRRGDDGAMALEL